MKRTATITFSSKLHDGFYWAGYTDAMNEGQWRITSFPHCLTIIPTNFWTFGQPDNHNGMEHCATFQTEEHGMRDRSCRKTYKVVCMIPGFEIQTGRDYS